MAEQADAGDLKSPPFGGVGSNPTGGTNYFQGYFMGCRDCREVMMDFDLYSPDYTDLSIQTRMTCKRLCTPYYNALNAKEW